MLYYMQPREIRLTCMQTTTRLFTISEPESPRIDGFYSIQIRPTMDYEALKLCNVRSGSATVHGKH